MVEVECVGCGELFPDSVCRGRCPACGLYASVDAGLSRRVSGRKFKDEVRVYGFAGE